MSKLYSEAVSFISRMHAQKMYINIAHLDDNEVLYQFCVVGSNDPVGQYTAQQIEKMAKMKAFL